MMIPRITLLTVAICSLALGCANTGGSGGCAPATDTTGGNDTTGGADITGGNDASTTTKTDGATTPNKDASTPTGDWTISKLQKGVDEKACATAHQGFHNGPKAVSLADVVVATPPLFKIAKTLDGIYVQSKGGGLWNGLYVVGPTGADIAKLKVGDVISVSGDVQDYYCQTQLKATSIGAAKGTEMPVSVTQTLDTVGVHAKPEDNEATESVLVSLENLVVSDPAPENAKSKKKFCGFWVGKDADDKALLVACTWGTTFATYDKDKSTWTTTVNKGDKVKSLKGVIQFSFDEYKLAPLGDAGIDWEK